MSFSMGGYVELFNKQCDLCDCRVFCKVCIVWYLEKIYDLFLWTHAKLYLRPYVDLSALLQTTLLVTWKKHQGNYISRNLWNLLYQWDSQILHRWWLMLSQKMSFSTPVLFFQPLSSPHNFDTLMISSVLENIFSFKIA